MIVVFLKRGLLLSEYAVDRPKTPLPMIRTEDGISTACGEAIAKTIPDIENEIADFRIE